MFLETVIGFLCIDKLSTLVNPKLFSDTIYTITGNLLTFLDAEFLVDKEILRNIVVT